MITRTYDDDLTAYRTGGADYVETARYRDPGGITFVWVAWALGFAFWAFTMSSFFGILRALSSGATMAVLVGLVALAAAAWAASRWSGRDTGPALTTEASTAALYDSVERNGGDDMVSRSPEARRPEERDSYRPA